MRVLHMSLLMELGPVGGRRGPGRLRRWRRDSCPGFCRSPSPAQFWLLRTLPWPPLRWNGPAPDSSGIESPDNWSKGRRRISAAPPGRIALAEPGSARWLHTRRAPAAVTPGRPRLPDAPGPPVAAAALAIAAVAAHREPRRLAPRDSAKAK